jgi:hypothetical protein
LGTERIAGAAAPSAMAAVGFRGGSDARQFARAGAGVAFGAEGYRSAD